MWLMGMWLWSAALMTFGFLLGVMMERGAVEDRRNAEDAAKRAQETWDGHDEP